MKFSLIVFLLLALICGFVFADNPQVTIHVQQDGGEGISGDIVLELFPDEAPVTVDNFVSYVQSGFFDGVIFHRVINDFMIQGGGFDADLNLTEPNTTIINESSNGLSNVRGTISMARSKHPHSAGTQFFINDVNNTHLDYVPIMYDYEDNSYSRYGYCVFGEVVSGMDVVDDIAAVATSTQTSAAGYDMNDVPVNDVIMQSVTVTYPGPVCLEKFDGDVNGDCEVDLIDLAIMSQDWALCNSITDSCD